MAQLNITQRVMMRRAKHLPFWAKLMLVLSLGATLIFYGTLLHAYFYNPLASESYLEMDKCPACYGKEHCRDFLSSDYKFASFITSRFFRFVNVKNVYKGEYKGEQIVVKKLAQNSEISKIDKEICKSLGGSVNCDVSDAIFSYNSQAGGNKNWFLSRIHGLSDMTTCPTERLLNRIMDKYVEKIDAIDLSGAEKMQVIYTLMVNSEPLVLQTFPKSENWPFPKYISACGRYVVEEYIGETLGDYYTSSWEKRVKLAYEILKTADSLTDNDSQFALYWTDLNYENIGVQSGKNIVIIDAENVIVVDRWQIKWDKKPGWDAPYYHKYDHCPHNSGTCLTVEPDKLCTSYTADHNYYAACRNLLSSYASHPGRPGGLLYGLPDEIESRNDLKALLNECAKPSENSLNRLRTKDKLLEILKAIAQQS